MVDKICSMFKVLGDETRCRVFSLLLQGELNVGEIAKQLGISQSLVSHHLHDLRMVGLVKQRREGVRIYYSIEKSSLKGIIKALEDGADNI